MNETQIQQLSDLQLIEAIYQQREQIAKFQSGLSYLEQELFKRIEESKKDKE